MGRRKLEETKPVTFRLPIDLIEQIDTAKWDLRMPKVDVMKTALSEFFEKYGIHPRPDGTRGLLRKGRSSSENPLEAYIGGVVHGRLSQDIDSDLYGA
ncbi:MAG: hypothetical protein HY709_12075 [Candidatus Latescibacteria bacterium]|nr:hypothetical protein [Candidatus Latescibacterota bacterium]